MRAIKRNGYDWIESNVWLCCHSISTRRFTLHVGGCLGRVIPKTSREMYAMRRFICLGLIGTFSSAVSAALLCVACADPAPNYTIRCTPEQYAQATLRAFDAINFLDGYVSEKRRADIFDQALRRHCAVTVP